MVFKKSFGIVSLMMAVALMLGACTGKSVHVSAPVAEASPRPTQAAPPEKAKITLAVGGRECVCYLPATLAYEMGFFKEEGLDVQLQDLQGGSKALEALLGGSADVVSGYYEHTIRMQAKGKSIQSFVNFSEVPGMALVVSKQAAGRIKSVKDLKGAKVGVSSPGSATHAMANYLLSQAGLKPDDISVVGIGLGSTAVAAIEHGSVDAAVTLDPAITQLVNRGSVTVLVDTRTQDDTMAVFGKGGYTAGSLYATTDFINKYPNTTQRLANAITKALQLINNESAESIAGRMPESYYAGDKALYVASIRAAKPGFSRDGLLSNGAAQNTLNVLALSDDSVRAAKDNIRLETTYTNEFASHASK